MTQQPTHRIDFDGPPAAGWENSAPLVRTFPATGGNFQPPPPPQPIEQGRAMRLVSPFKTGLLVGLGFIVAGLVPFAVLIFIVMGAAASQPSTF